MEDKRESTGSTDESESLYRHLVELSPEGIGLCDISGEIITINRQALRMGGFESKEELLEHASNGFEFFPEDELPRAMANLQILQEKGELRNVVHTAIRKDGSTFQVEMNVTLIRDADGNPYRFMVVARDVTSRAHSERQLQESETKYRLLAERSLQGLGIVQGDPMRVVYVNETLARYLGRTVEQLIALDPTDIPSLIHPDDVARILGQYQSRISGDSAENRYEVRAFRPDGTTRWLELLSNRIDLGGQAAAQVVCSDITERKRAELELAKRYGDLVAANEQLEAMHRSKDELIATLGHELRTPLVTGLGYLELALNGQLGSLPEEATTKLEVSLKRLRQLSTLVDDILGYHSTLRGRRRRSLELASLDVADLFRDSVSDLRVRDTALAREVQVDVAQGCPPVLVDETMLRRVLSNLLDNAVCHAGPQASIQLAAQRDGEAVRLSVSDNGEGIPAELRDRVLEPFFKAPGSGGTGLGLAIVCNILRAHDSEVRLESEPGRGTSVSFPLRVAGS